MTLCSGKKYLPSLKRFMDPTLSLGICGVHEECKMQDESHDAGEIGVLAERTHVTGAHRVCE